jgi:hypothetical protein
VEPEPSLADELRLLARDVTRRLGRLRGGGQPAIAVRLRMTPPDASTTTRMPTSIPPLGEGRVLNISPGRAIACTDR